MVVWRPLHIISMAYYDVLQAVRWLSAPTMFSPPLWRLCLSPAPHRWERGKFRTPPPEAPPHHPEFGPQTRFLSLPTPPPRGGGSVGAPPGKKVSVKQGPAGGLPAASEPVRLLASGLHVKGIPLRCAMLFFWIRDLLICSPNRFQFLIYNLIYTERE